MADIDNEQKEEVQTNEMEGMDSSDQVDTESMKPQDSDSKEDTHTRPDASADSGAETADGVIQADEVAEAKDAVDKEATSRGEISDGDADGSAAVKAEAELKQEDMGESEDFVKIKADEVAQSDGAIAAAALIASQTPVEEVEETPKVEEPEDDRHWYVVHCYSGYENKVQHNLEQRIETMGMKDRIFDVVVPTEEEIEVKEGKRRTVERRVFPGYILVQMIMSEESWYVVRNTPGVTGFVGMGNEPTALRPEEVSSIIKRMEADAPRIKLTYAIGQKVRIIDGPFNDFIGTVDDIDMERAKVRVMVSFFGRDTPVELDFLQVEKS